MPDGELVANTHSCWAPTVASLLSTTSVRRATAAAATPGPHKMSLTKSRPPADKPSPTLTTSVHMPVPRASSIKPSTLSVASMSLSITPASCAIVCCSRWPKKSGTQSSRFTSRELLVRVVSLPSIGATVQKMARPMMRASSTHHRLLVCTPTLARPTTEPPRPALLHSRRSRPKNSVATESRQMPLLQVRSRV